MVALLISRQGRTLQGAEQCLHTTNTELSVLHSFGAYVGRAKFIAWKDFCDDVDRQDLRDVTPELDAINRGGCAVLG